MKYACLHVVVGVVVQYCNFPRRTGSEFCGAHTVAAPGAASGDGSDAAPAAKFRQRIPCPVDPRHTIFATDVEKHKLVCNVTKDERKRLQVCRETADAMMGMMLPCMFCVVYSCRMWWRASTAAACHLTMLHRCKQCLAPAWSLLSLPRWCAC